MNVVICTHILRDLSLPSQFLFIENGQSRVIDYNPIRDNSVM